MTLNSWTAAEDHMADDKDGKDSGRGISVVACGWNPKMHQKYEIRDFVINGK